MKKLKVFLLCTILSASFITPCWASTIQYSTSVQIVLQEISIKSEVTKWYYRKHEGIKQKRLWSITYGYWKTDWMSV